MGQIAVLMDYRSVIVALTPVLVDYREVMVELSLGSLDWLRWFRVLVGYRPFRWFISQSLWFQEWSELFIEQLSWLFEWS